jgi:hypothetical protein
MADMNIIHFLKISGMILQHRKHEFENMVKYACGQLPEECIEKNLAIEISDAATYYFFAAWCSETALRKFIASEEYQLIRSAYDAMGILHKIEIGYHAEIKTIHINH